MASAKASLEHSSNSRTKHGADEDSPSGQEILDERERSLDRVGSRLVRSMFSQLRHLSRADRLHVLMACRGRLARLSGGGGERVELCLNSMRLCRLDEGKLSAGAYNRWRDRQPNRGEHPSVQFITDTFESWRLAKDAAGAEVVGSVLARRLLGTSDEFTPAQMIEGLLEYAATGAPLVFRGGYFEWAREQMASPTRKQPRYVVGANTINKAFGSWAGFVCAAGLGHRLETDRVNGSVLPAGPRDEYSRSACIRSLQEAGAECGGANMRVSAYDAWALKRSRKALAAGEVLFIPRSQALEKKLGSWAECLHAAGLIDDNEFKLRRERHRRSMGDRELATWVARAMADLGPDPSEGNYKRWRTSQGRVEFPPQVPTAKVIANRLGGWARACQLGREILAAEAPGPARTPSAPGGEQNASTPSAGGKSASTPSAGGKSASPTAGERQIPSERKEASATTASDRQSATEKESDES